MSDDDLRLALYGLHKEGLAAVRRLIVAAIEGEAEEAEHQACVLDYHIGRSHRQRARNGRR